MALPEINPNRPYTGSPFGHPHAKEIGKFSGLLADQTAEFQAAVASLRARRTSHELDYAPMPTSIELVMSDKTLIKSMLTEMCSISPQSGSVRLVLHKWNGSQFTWATVDIDVDDLTVVVRRNPHDPWNNWRPTNPTIFPAAATAE